MCVIWKESDYNVGLVAFWKKKVYETTKQINKQDCPRTMIQLPHRNKLITPRTVNQMIVLIWYCKIWMCYVYPRSIRGWSQVHPESIPSLSRVHPESILGQYRVHPFSFSCKQHSKIHLTFYKHCNYFFYAIHDNLWIISTAFRCQTVFITHIIIY